MHVAITSGSDCCEGPFFHDGQSALAKKITDQILERVPSLFGKLVLLSSLCNRRTGEYHHPAVDQAAPANVACEVLQRSHERVFSTWLDLTLEEQWKTLSEYFAAPHAGQVEAQHESREDFWKTLIPQAAREPERELFLSDLSLVLCVLDTAA